jgi:hypothetical protein
MADRWLTDGEKLLAHQLRSQGKSYEAIAEIIADVSEDGHRPHRATVYRALQKMPDSPEDAPFVWHHLEKYQLPWEASEFLLQMWRFAITGGLAPISRNWPTPTVRQMRWFWRVHLAAPGLKSEEAIWFLAQRFVQRELRIDLLGQPLGMEDLTAFLAFTPWASPEHKDSYKQAVSEGRIPALQKETQSALDGLRTEMQLLDSGIGSPADSFIALLTFFERTKAAMPNFRVWTTAPQKTPEE